MLLLRLVALSWARAPLRRGASVSDIPACVSARPRPLVRSRASACSPARAGRITVEIETRSVLANRRIIEALRDVLDAAREAL
jgi:hypothetical protein